MADKSSGACGVTDAMWDRLERRTTDEVMNDLVCVSVESVDLKWIDRRRASSRGLARRSIGIGYWAPRRLAGSSCAPWPRACGVCRAGQIKIVQFVCARKFRAVPIQRRAQQRRRVGHADDERSGEARTYALKYMYKWKYKEIARPPGPRIDITQSIFGSVFACMRDTKTRVFFFLLS